MLCQTSQQNQTNYFGCIAGSGAATDYHLETVKKLNYKIKLECQPYWSPILMSSLVADPGSGDGIMLNIKVKGDMEGF